MIMARMNCLTTPIAAERASLVTSPYKIGNQGHFLFCHNNKFHMQQDVQQEMHFGHTFFCMTNVEEWSARQKVPQSNIIVGMFKVMTDQKEQL